MPGDRVGLGAALDALDAAMLSLAAIFQRIKGDVVDTVPYTVQIAQGPSFNMIVGGADVTLSSIVRNAAGGAIAGAAVTYTSDTPSVATVGSTTTLGSDAFTRADNTTMGTADTGGAWTAQSGTWGIGTHRAQCQTLSANQKATLSLSASPAFVSSDFVTDAIDTHSLGLILRYVDASNFLSVTYASGVTTLASRVAGVNTDRMTVTSGLPTSGSASWNGSAAIDPTTNVVTCYVNGTAVGTTYTLTSTELTAYGSAVMAGYRQSYTSGATYVSADNFLATSSVNGVVHAVSASATTLGSDALTRADSASTLGTADTGGAWTAQSGTWGVTTNKGYSVTGGDGDVATLTLASSAVEVGAAIATDAIDKHVDGVVLRYTNASNYLFATARMGQGTIKLYSVLAGVLNQRMVSGVVLPTTGSALFTIAAAINSSNVVTCSLNGAQVGASYTLTSAEITAYGASLLSGVRHAWAATSTSTAATFDNWYAKGASTATITATTANGKTGTAIVLVSVDTVPYQIVMTPSTISFAVGDPDVTVASTITNLEGSVLPAEAATYTSNATGVFTVGASSGVVHAVAAGTGVLTATTSNGKFTTSSVTVTSTAPTGSRPLIFPSVRLRQNFRATLTADQTFEAAKMSDVVATAATLSTLPSAVTVQRYSRLQSPEIDTGSSFGTSWTAAADDPFSAVRCEGFATAYASTHSHTLENYWLHARTGDPNTVAGVAAVSAGGVASFANNTTSYPYTVGGSVVLAGLTTGNGTYVIASLQLNGVTLTSWSAGAIVAQTGTLSITGLGTLVTANRSQVWTGSAWRNLLNAGSAQAQTMHAARFVGVASNGGAPINGALVDEMSAAVYTNTAIRSVEYGTTGSAQYGTDLAMLLGVIKATTGSPFLRCNIGASMTAQDLALATAAKGVLLDGALDLYGSTTTTLDWFTKLLGLGIEAEFVDDTAWDRAANHGGVTPNPGVNLGLPASLTAGNYPTTTARHQMSAFSYYLLGVDPTGTVNGVTHKFGAFDSTNAAVGDSPLSSRYQQAFQANVGQPTGLYTRGTFTVDGASQGCWPLTRVFSNDGGTTLSACTVFNAPAHEPAGMTTIYDFDMKSQGAWLNSTTGTNTTPPSGNAGPWTWVFDAQLGQNVTRLTYGPWTVPGGSTYGPGHGYISVSGNPLSYYLRFLLKQSVGWVNNPTGAQKLFQWFDHSNGEGGGLILFGFAPKPQEAGFSGYTLQSPVLSPTSLTYGNGTTFGQTDAYEDAPKPPDIFSPGIWHTMEVLYVGNTPGAPDGRFRTWMDGKVQVSLDDVIWEQTGVSPAIIQFDLNALWGGLGGTLSAAQYMDMGPIHLSGSASRIVGPLP